MLASSELSLKFYDDVSAQGVEKEIAAIVSSGARRILLAPHSEGAAGLKGKWWKDGIAVDVVSEGDAEGLASKAGLYDAVILTEKTDLDHLSSMLLSCLDMTTGTVIAPVTADYYKNRQIYMMTTPKSGTHMLIGMLEGLGIRRNFSSVPKPGMWSTLDDFAYHAPCKDFFAIEWFYSVGRHPLFRSPAIFMYRNPLDVAVSELSWYQKADNGFSHFMKTLKDNDERLMRVIVDKTVFGTIRDRILRYAGWLDFVNVIPVSYEEFVGARGGGDDAEQIKTIWSMQLKLHIPGTPADIAGRLYDEKSPTFEKGKAGRHRDVFTKRHYDAFAAIDQDFMDMMGYAIDGSMLPHYVDKFRRRPLKVWRISEAELWTQRLLKESYFGFNIVAVAGQYAAIAQECGAVDLSKEDDRRKKGVYLGLDSAEDAMRLIMYKEMEKKVEGLNEKVEGLNEKVEGLNEKVEGLLNKIQSLLLYKAYKAISKFRK